VETNELDIIWFTGYFEGEGTFANHAKAAVSLQITTTDCDIAYRCQEAAGGRVNGPYIASGNSVKDYYVWVLNRREEVIVLINRMLPYLGERRTIRAVEALERLSQGDLRRSIAVCGEMSGYRRHHSNKEPVCSACLKARRDWYHKNK
jgi:hypothetical protein